MEAGDNGRKNLWGRRHLLLCLLSHTNLPPCQVNLAECKGINTLPFSALRTYHPSHWGMPCIMFFNQSWFFVSMIDNSLGLVTLLPACLPTTNAHVWSFFAVAVERMHHTFRWSFLFLKMRCALFFSGTYVYFILHNNNSNSSRQKTYTHHQLQAYTVNESQWCFEHQNREGGKTG